MNRVLGKRRGPSMSWCQLSAARRQLAAWCKATGLKESSTCIKVHRAQLATLQGTWPPKLSSDEVRNVFLSYFHSKGHKFVPSSSVIAKKNEGSYFNNAGMNQFKPIFLGQVDGASEMGKYRRVTNSQKCIRVGGKHNDLDEVGRDTYHHTFFEMLGSWSFGDYFKVEACNMAWELLTKVYRIPPKHLYVTYFGGDEAAGLAPDNECRDIWLQIGVPSNRLIPKGMEDNFWDMGFQGPCGPCTEIHFDHQGRPDATHLFNLGHPEVVEIWNLVFMQYDRKENGELVKLPQHHVDTGMGLERLTAVLNGTTSNYATDLFVPLFSYLQKHGNDIPAYGDKVGTSDFGGVDKAYRIVADHARMFTVALSDGLRPNPRDVGRKLRTVMHRAIKAAHQVLGLSPGKISGLVPLITHSLGETFPLIVKEQNHIIDWTDHTERQYFRTIEQSRKMLHKALKKYNNSSSFLTGEQIHEIVEGRFGQAVTLDTLMDLAEDYNIQLNLNAYKRIVEHHNAIELPILPEGANETALDQQDIQELADKNIPPTQDDLKYSYLKKSGAYELISCESKVLALQSDGEFTSFASQGESIGVILDQTSFYAESGGQVADYGQLLSNSGSIIEITDVQKFGDYVLHMGKVAKGQVKVGETLKLEVDAEKRFRCMQGHTATHIINFALEKTLGGVIQLGSCVSPSKLTFKFFCKKPLVITDEDIRKVQNLAQKLVDSSLPVYKAEVPLSAAQTIHGLRTMPQAVYPSKVTVVSVGARTEELLQNSDLSGIGNSVELCGGTHVENSSDIGAIVITHFAGRNQGVKSLAAVTGQVALQALENRNRLEEMAEELTSQVKSKLNPNQLEKKSAEILKLAAQPMPKADKDRILESLKHTHGNVLNAQKKIQKRNALNKEIYEVLNSNTDPFVVAHIDFEKPSEVYKVLSKMRINKPIMLVSNNKQTRKTALAICYVPPEKREEVNQKRWAARICEIMGGKFSQPTDKIAKKHFPDSLNLTFNFRDMASLEKTIHEARKYVHNTIKFKL